MRLLDDHGEALEADLRREYQADLQDLWRGRLDWRQLRVMVLGLPPAGTAIARSIRGTAAGDWTATDELLRHLATITQDHVWGFFESHRDPKSASLPRPTPIPSPLEANDDDEPTTRTPKGARIANAAETFAILRDALG